VLDTEGIGCIVFSPLAQGLLTDKYLTGIPEGSRLRRATSSSRKHHADKRNRIALNNAAGADKSWRKWPWPGCCATRK